MRPNRNPSKTGGRTVAQFLRAVRDPLVALCAVLLLGNHLVPVATFAAEDGFHICSAASPQSHDGDGGAHHRFQSCCFSAAMGVVPAAMAEPLPHRALAFAALKPLAEHVRAARPARSARIRAPPLS